MLFNEGRIWGLWLCRRTAFYFRFCRLHPMKPRRCRNTHWYSTPHSLMTSLLLVCLTVLSSFRFASSSEIICSCIRSPSRMADIFSESLGFRFSGAGKASLAIAVHHRQLAIKSSSPSLTTKTMYQVTLDRLRLFCLLYLDIYCFTSLRSFASCFRSGRRTLLRQN